MAETPAEPTRWGALPLGAYSLPAAQLRCLGVLAAYADREGVVTTCGRARLAEYTGLNERTVRHALDGLAADGWLTVTPGDGRRYSLFTLHRHPFRSGAHTPPGGAPTPSPGGPGDPPTTEVTDPPEHSVPSERPTAPRHEEPDMTRAAHDDPAQMGLDLGVPEPAPKERKVNGPQAVLEAYEAAYVTEHRKPSLRPVGRTRAEAKRLLQAGEPLERVIEAAESLAQGGNVFHALDEECRRIRAQEERVERARTAPVAENYGGSDASVPTTWIYG